MPPLADGFLGGHDPHRREVLRLIAAGAAASLAGCSKPDQPIVPAVRDEDGDRAGRTRRYATTLALAGYGRGATALVVDGRPIKLEGSANHPASLGATDLFTETAILDLYDPQRLRAPAGPEGISGWPMLERTLIARLAGSAGEGRCCSPGASPRRRCSRGSPRRRRGCRGCAMSVRRRSTTMPSAAARHWPSAAS